MYANVRREKGGCLDPAGDVAKAETRSNVLKLQTDASYVPKWEDLRLLECLT